MNDTSPKMAKLFIELMMLRSPEDRVRMGCSMFSTAREIVLSSLPRGLNETQKRVALFNRFYAHDFDKTTGEKIITLINSCINATDNIEFDVENRRN